VSKYIEMAHRYFVVTPLKSTITVPEPALAQASVVAAEVDPKPACGVRAAPSAKAALKVNVPVA